MKQNAEMIRDACILSNNPDVLLDFISDQIVNEILQNELQTSQSHMAMLASITPEEPLERATFDPFHNPYICYVASAEDAFVESKLYVCVSIPGSKAVMWKKDHYVIEGAGLDKVASVEILSRYLRKNRPGRKFETCCTKMNPGNLSLKIGREPVADMMKMLLNTYPPENVDKCHRFEQSCFLVINKVGNVGLFVLLKFGN